MLTPGANVANVVTVAGPDYSAWHYAPDAPVRLTRGSDGRVDLHILVGAWSAAPTAETVTVRWQVTDGPGAGAESVVPTADVTPVDAEFADRLRTVDDAPVTGPRPLAVTPYRLALARRGNRYAEAVVRGVAEGAAVRYTVEVRPTSGAPVTLGPYSVVAAVPEFTPGDVVGGRFGDLVDAGPAWVGHVRRDDGLTHVRVDLDDIPADGSLPVRVRIGGTWLSADYLTAPSNPDGRLPLLDWAADTVTFSGPDPDGAPVEFDVGGRRVAEADAGGPGRARLLIAHFCIQAMNDLLEEPFDGYVPPRTYMQVTMADEDGRYSSRPGAERINPGGYRDGLTMHRTSRRASRPSRPTSAPRRGRPTCSTPTSGSTGSGPPRSRRCGPPPSATSYSTRPRATTTTRPPPSRPARATTTGRACCGPTARAARTCCSSTPR